MTDIPAKDPYLFVRVPHATHALLLDLARDAGLSSSVSRYVLELIEAQRPGGPQLPPRRKRGRPATEKPAREPRRGRERVAFVAPVEVAPVEAQQLEEAPKKRRGRPRKVIATVEAPVAVPPKKRHRVALEAAPAADVAHEPGFFATTTPASDTLDRIRAALDRLEGELNYLDGAP